MSPVWNAIVFFFIFIGILSADGPMTFHKWCLTTEKSLIFSLYHRPDMGVDAVEPHNLDQNRTEPVKCPGNQC